MAELYESSEKLFVDAIWALSTAIDAKDPGTQGHSARVSDYSVLIAQEIGLDTTKINEIRDQQFTSRPGEDRDLRQDLNKRGRLTSDERKQIQHHPIIGAKILGQIDALSSIVPGILEHHERLDGSGYPFGLSGDQITQFADYCGSRCLRCHDQLEALQGGAKRGRYANLPAI